MYLSYVSYNYVPGGVGLATQTHTAAPPGLALFLHVPAFPFTVQAAPLLHNAPPGGVVHVPGSNIPACCSNPGKPSSLEQAPLYSCTVLITITAPLAMLRKTAVSR